jgi:hypothetical protein
VDSFLPPPTWVDAITGATKTAPASASVSYIPGNTYDDPATPNPNVEEYPVVWPDTMPMSPVLGVERVYNNAGAADTVEPMAPAGGWATKPLPATLAALVPLSTIDPNTPKYAKGDLRMRATVVYHYADNADDPNTPAAEQTPIACISSYYDPSTSLTAKNLNALPFDNAPTGSSNNGIVYGFPTTARPGVSGQPGTNGLLGGGSPTDLERQANYVFPNGRFANEPLRKALLTDPIKRTFADNAAIDATNCSFEILKGKAPDASVIPHGAIEEVAFLDGRQTEHSDRAFTRVFAAKQWHHLCYERRRAARSQRSRRNQLRFRRI